MQDEQTHGNKDRSAELLRFRRQLTTDLCEVYKICIGPLSTDRDANSDNQLELLANELLNYFCNDSEKIFNKLCARENLTVLLQAMLIATNIGAAQLERLQERSCSMFDQNGSIFFSLLSEEQIRQLLAFLRSLSLNAAYHLQLRPSLKCVTNIDQPLLNRQAERIRWLQDYYLAFIAHRMQEVAQQHRDGEVILKTAVKGAVGSAAGLALVGLGVFLRGRQPMPAMRSPRLARQRDRLTWGMTMVGSGLALAQTALAKHWLLGVLSGSATLGTTFYFQQYFSFLERSLECEQQRTQRALRLAARLSRRTGGAIILSGTAVLTGQLVVTADRLYELRRAECVQQPQLAELASAPLNANGANLMQQRLAKPLPYLVECIRLQTLACAEPVTLWGRLKQLGSALLPGTPQVAVQVSPDDWRLLLMGLLLSDTATVAMLDLVRMRTQHFAEAKLLDAQDLIFLVEYLSPLGRPLTDLRRQKISWVLAHVQFDWAMTAQADLALDYQREHGLMELVVCLPRLIVENRLQPQWPKWQRELELLMELDQVQQRPNFWSAMFRVQDAAQRNILHLIAQLHQESTPKLFLAWLRSKLTVHDNPISIVRTQCVMQALLAQDIDGNTPLHLLTDNKSVIENYGSFIILMMTTMQWSSDSQIVQAFPNFIIQLLSSSNQRQQYFTQTIKAKVLEQLFTSALIAPLQYQLQKYLDHFIEHYGSEIAAAYNTRNGADNNSDSHQQLDCTTLFILNQTTGDTLWHCLAQLPQLLTDLLTTLALEEGTVAQLTTASQAEQERHILLIHYFNKSSEVINHKGNNWLYELCACLERHKAQKDLQNSEIKAIAALLAKCRPNLVVQTPPPSDRDKRQYLTASVNQTILRLLGQFNDAFETPARLFFCQQQLKPLAIFQPTGVIGQLATKDLTAVLTMHDSLCITPVGAPNSGATTEAETLDVIIMEFTNSIVQAKTEKLAFSASLLHYLADCNLSVLQQALFRGQRIEFCYLLLRLFYTQEESRKILPNSNGAALFLTFFQGQMSSLFPLRKACLKIAPANLQKQQLASNRLLNMLCFLMFDEYFAIDQTTGNNWLHYLLASHVIDTDGCLWLLHIFQQYAKKYNDEQKLMRLALMFNDYGVTPLGLSLAQPESFGMDQQQAQRTSLQDTVLHQFVLIDPFFSQFDKFSRTALFKRALALMTPTRVTRLAQLLWRCQQQDLVIKTFLIDQQVSILQQIKYDRMLAYLFEPGLNQASGICQEFCAAIAEQRWSDQEKNQFSQFLFNHLSVEYKIRLLKQLLTIDRAQHKDSETTGCLCIHFLRQLIAVLGGAVLPAQQMAPIGLRISAARFAVALLIDVLAGIVELYNLPALLKPLWPDILHLLTLPFPTDDKYYRQRYISCVATLLSYTKPLFVEEAQQQQPPQQSLASRALHTWVCKGCFSLSEELITLLVQNLAIPNNQCRQYLGDIFRGLATNHALSTPVIKCVLQNFKNNENIWNYLITNNFTILLEYQKFSMSELDDDYQAFSKTRNNFLLIQLLEPESTQSEAAKSFIKHCGDDLILGISASWRWLTTSGTPEELSFIITQLSEVTAHYSIKIKKVENVGQCINQLKGMSILCRLCDIIEHPSSQWATVDVNQRQELVFNILNLLIKQQSTVAVLLQKMLYFIGEGLAKDLDGQPQHALLAKIITEETKRVRLFSKSHEWHWQKEEVIKKALAEAVQPMDKQLSCADEITELEVTDNSRIGPSGY